MARRLPVSERKALAYLARHPEGTSPAAVGHAITGGLKTNGGRMKAQGLGFVGAKALASLRRQSLAAIVRDSSGYPRHVATESGLQVLRKQHGA